MNSEVWNIANMTHARKPPLRHQVNWDDPDLKSLLDKTDGWGLDNRGVFDPVECELHVGWGAGAARSATLVYEANGVLVIEADFIIPVSEHVRIDYMQAGALRSSWGTVAEARAGKRVEDHANGIHVYWVHLR
ncbi:hypothetical protein PY254_05930 [Rhodanobacter sp. AS-Z3]|uniref:hypothetical protein n=1 Tax=Rhodanobacter sp. AS-Z3 TaxID=3031330 RepID=UPI0024794887|nr:hypothetical protein [Rhodanobacter sp. AS-Z3]WEN16205.1 hypothetical protein PY254_05930 [Rhodanobacter sp. AS-Z3]